METLKADSGGKRKLLVFTLGKTQDIQESGNVLAINRHREALSTIVNQIDILKLQVVEERFKEGNSEEDITKLSTEIEDQVVQVDIKVTHINEHLASLKSEDDSKAQETEKELKAKEREEQKLEYEWKIEESKKDRATKSSEAKASPASEGARTNLPKLTITKFNGSHTDWLRFWNIYEAEIDKCSDMAAVTELILLITSRTNALKLPIQAKEGRFS